VVDEPFAGGPIEIDPTPLTGGGFCLTFRGGRLGRHEGGAVSLLGWVSRADAEQLVLRYEDGVTSQIELFRVTEPVEAGFFLFDVPEARTASAPRGRSESARRRRRRRGPNPHRVRGS
jgi:hypothetical protein